MEMIATVVGFGCGSIFFPSTFFLLKRYLFFRFSGKLEISVIYNISGSCVNILQAILSCLAGAIVVTHCQNDIMKDRHWLTNTYAFFAMPYFYYDSWAMYQAHLHLYPEIQKNGQSFAVKHFVQENKLMMLHHLFFPLIFAPAIFFFRHGIGDFFVGVFYLIEMTVPFISARNIMMELKLKDHSAYIIVGLVMIATFFISRILVFPFLFWKYSKHAGLSIWQVPWAIPIKCNTGCLTLLALQLYWFGLMIRGACKAFHKIYQRSKIK